MKLHSHHQFSMKAMHVLAMFGQSSSHNLTILRNVKKSVKDGTNFGVLLKASEFYDIKL
jgi:hypothetical protein